MENINQYVDINNFASGIPKYDESSPKKVKIYEEIMRIKKEKLNLENRIKFLENENSILNTSAFQFINENEPLKGISTDGLFRLTKPTIHTSNNFFVKNVDKSENSMTSTNFARKTMYLNPNQNKPKVQSKIMDEDYPQRNMQINTRIHTTDDSSFNNDLPLKSSVSPQPYYHQQIPHTPGILHNKKNVVSENSFLIRDGKKQKGNESRSINQPIRIKTTKHIANTFIMLGEFNKIRTSTSPIQRNQFLLKDAGKSEIIDLYNGNIRKYNGYDKSLKLNKRIISNNSFIY